MKNKCKKYPLGKFCQKLTLNNKQKSNWQKISDLRKAELINLFLEHNSLQITLQRFRLTELLTGKGTEKYFKAKRCKKDNY